MIVKTQGLISVSLLILAGCQALPEPSLALSTAPAIASVAPVDHRVVYRLGVPPMRSTRRLWSRYQPLVDQVNAQVTGFRLELESAQSEPNYEEKYRRRLLDVMVMEPSRVVEAESLGYSVAAQTGSGDRIAGLIAVRRDAKINRVNDLRGRTISFSSPQALASTLMVRMWLREASFPLDRAAHVVYTGSQEGALLNVLIGSSDAAGVSKEGWESFIAQYSFARSKVEARWLTDDLPGSALMVQRRLSRQDRRQVVDAFLSLKTTPAGRAALAQAGYSEFRFGDSASYDPIWEFLNQYQHAFGPIAVASRVAP